MNKELLMQAFIYAGYSIERAKREADQELSYIVTYEDLCDEYKNTNDKAPALEDIKAGKYEDLEFVICDNEGELKEYILCIAH